MARIAILGASGKLGQKLVDRAVEQGHSVNALTRHPARIKRQNEEVTIIQANAETGEGLDAGLERCQFVISAIGSSLRPSMEASMQQLVRRLEVLKRLERFVLISRLGTGDTGPQAQRASGAFQSVLPVLLMPVFRDLNLAEALVRNSGLPYTIIRSTRLTDEMPTNDVRVVNSTEPPPHRITRTDLAHYVIDSLYNPDLNRKEATVGSGPE